MAKLPSFGGYSLETLILNPLTEGLMRPFSLPLNRLDGYTRRKGFNVKLAINTIDTFPKCTTVVVPLSLKLSILTLMAATSPLSVWGVLH